VWAGDERLVAIGEGNGPVQRLDAALRSVLTQRYPALGRIHLTDYRSRVLEARPPPAQWCGSSSTRPTATTWSTVG
jgi:2-isopropylmalate synthase